MWISTALYLWLSLASALAGFVYCYSKNQFSYWAKRGIPFKKPHWLYGNMGDFVKGKMSLADFSVEFYNEFKGRRYGGIWRFFTPSLFLVDPKLINDVMVKDFGTWSSRGVTINFDVDPLSAHLVNLDGKKWKSVRSKLSPTFTVSKLKRMFNLLLDCSRHFLAYLDAVATNGEPVEAREMCARFTTDVIGSCAFGVEMNSLSDEENVFRKMVAKAFERTLRARMVRLFQISFPRLVKFFKLRVHTPDVTKFFVDLTKQNFEYREKNNVQRHDFMDLLRSLKTTGKPLDDTEVEFDDKLLAAQAYVFFTAGSETASATISYCLHELADNQDVQDRLRDEVRNWMAANNGEITWEGLSSMKYLDMIFQETLRKYPPIPVVLRTSVKPYRIPGTNVELPSGAECMIPIYALHHDPEFYPDPEKFDPERFADEGKRERLPSTFIPFGDGPRNCIGLRFAEQEAKLAIVKVIDKFEILLCEKSLNPLQIDPRSRFLFPKGGIWIRISKNPA